MRLLLLNYEFPPFGGGAGQATYFMAKELVRQGHQVDVLTSRLQGQAPEEFFHGVRVIRARSWRRGCHEAGLWGTATYLLFGLFKLRRLVRQNEYDLAHFFFALPTGALALFWKKATGKPYVVSLRGSDVPGYDCCDGNLNRLHRRLDNVTRRILGGATEVVANSASLRQLAWKTFPTEDISVITNGVCTNTFRPATNRFDRDGNRGLCVARLVPRKGLDILLKALTHEGAEHVRLDLVGEGPLASELVDLAARLGVEKRVNFHGALTGQSLHRRYRQADFFILPSLTESFSMSLLEAMASGLPVVASNVGGIPELVRDGENGFLVEPGDVAELGKAIAEMSNSRDAQQLYSANNREKIETRFTWAHITNRYLHGCYQHSVRTDESRELALSRQYEHP